MHLLDNLGLFALTNGNAGALQVARTQSVPAGTRAGCPPAPPVSGTSPAKVGKVCAMLYTWAWQQQFQGSSTEGTARRSEQGWRSTGRATSWPPRRAHAGQLLAARSAQQMSLARQKEPSPTVLTASQSWPRHLRTPSARARGCGWTRSGLPPAETPWPIATVQYSMRRISKAVTRQNLGGLRQRSARCERVAAAASRAHGGRHQGFQLEARGLTPVKSLHTSTGRPQKWRQCCLSALLC